MTLAQISAIAMGRRRDWPAMVQRYRAGWRLSEVAAAFGYDEAYTGWALTASWRAELPAVVVPQSQRRVYRPSRGRRAA